MTRWICFFALLTCAALHAAQPAPVSFSRDILPILSDNCFHCHGPDKTSRKSGLRLDTKEGAYGSGQSDLPAIVPGKSANSEVLKRLLTTDAEEVMPPPQSHKKLKKEQIELVRRWIDEGAVWGKHWSFEDLKRPAVPTVTGDAAKTQRNPIDAYIAERLAPHKLAPAPEASRETLIRRLSLDILGLPPTVAEVQAFVNNSAPDAYEKLVDRMLASPRYGERMAQHWLDVARYADTVGYHGDQNQNAWAYRDYVIAAFNSNKPFDVFTREQLAGDLLPNATPEQKTATCFNRLNMMTREGGAQPKEYLAKYNADRVRTVGMAWMGLTMGCAECHDHKFDPIKAKDFYSMAAFFGDVRQWGVYTTYNYTPNPDLAGFTNEHPFPPEIVVESPALKRRIEKIDGQLRDIAAAMKYDNADFAKWKTSISAFLAANPAGWETHKTDAKASDDKAPAKAEPAKGKGDKASKTNPKDKPGKTLELNLNPASRYAAALKVELLPGGPGKKIVTSGDSAEVKVEVSIVQNDKARKVGTRFAVADLYAKRYSSGFEVLGVQGGWKTEAKNASEPHTAVYFIDPPVVLKDGETLRVVVNSSSELASVRVSTSPLAPSVFHKPAHDTDLAAQMKDEARARLAYLRGTACDATAFATVKTLEAEKVRYQGGTVPVMVTERAPKTLPIRVLPRGNWQDDSGELCVPATPHFLPALKKEGPLDRNDLATWLCSPENPLTPRVVMNRLWKQFFGTGLSAQTDDLGAQGEPPSHPELLDWLAVEFRDNGWDTKRMVKQVVLSHTYRQVSGLRPELKDIDPSNRLLAAQNPRRLEAEIVRDNALAIAGLLNLEMGGPPAKPYQPDDYYEGLQFPDRKYIADKDERQYRRGVYTHWQRTFLHPMLANFDAPSREDCIALRTAANSPQQALTLLNDITFVEAARVWAARLLAEAPKSDDARIALALQQAVSRTIKESEKASLTAFLTKMRAEYKARPEDAAKLKKVGFAPAPEGVDDVELAAWTSVCRVILNLHETITRN